MLDSSGEVPGSRADSDAPAGVAPVLAAAGLLLLAIALWTFLTSLPDVLGANGSHMAGDAKLGIVLVTLPLALVALLLLSLAWSRARRRRQAGRLIAAAVALAAAATIGSVGALAMPVLPAEALIPADAPRVHVSMAGGTLMLEPAQVRSGPVYLLIDSSASQVALIGRSYATQEEVDAHRGREPGPLTDAEVEAIAKGDTYMTSTFAGLGDVSRWDFLPGKYVMVSDDPTILASQGGGQVPAGYLVVLTVVGAPSQR